MKKIVSLIVASLKLSSGKSVPCGTVVLFLLFSASHGAGAVLDAG